MTHQYIVQTIILENSRNFSIENGTCLRSRFALDINPFIIQFHITQTIYGILSVMADNHIWTGNGNRQNTPVTFKTARQLAVLIIQTELLHRSDLLCRLIFFRRFRTGRPSRSFTLRFLSCCRLCGSLSSGFPTSFLLCTLSSFLYFNFNQTVNLGIQLLSRTFFLPYLALYTFLLLLQIRQKSLALLFLNLQFGLFNLTLF